MAVVAGYILSRGSNTRHISWQEFRTQYLERGEVERLQVVDKNVVRVYLRSDASVAKTSGVRDGGKGAVVRGRGSSTGWWGGVGSEGQR